MRIKYKDYPIYYKELSNEWILYDIDDENHLYTKNDNKVIKNNSLKKIKLIIDKIVEEKILLQTENTEKINFLYNKQNISFDENSERWHTKSYSNNQEIIYFKSLSQAKKYINKNINKFIIIINDKLHFFNEIKAYKQEDDYLITSSTNLEHFFLSTLIKNKALIIKETIISTENRIIIKPENILSYCSNIDKKNKR